MSVPDTITRIRAFSAAREMPLNVFLIRDLITGAVPHTVIPTSPVSLAILLSCYKMFCPSKALSAISEQSAKPIQILRNSGFLFDSDGGPNRLVRVAGVRGRRISGFRADEGRRVAGMTLTAKQRSAFVDGKRDPYNGMSRDMEIDHRQPVEASARLGQDYPDISPETIASGEADLHYQALTKSSNLAKRGACHNCLQGEEIRVPLVGEEIEQATGQRYKRRFEDNLAHNEATGAPGCAGCYFYNIALRMGQDFRKR